MQSFSRRKKLEETETLIKESLLRQLSYSIKEIQLSTSQKDDIFSSKEGYNSLVVILEAIFLHGLKQGLLKTALKVMSGLEETKPQPSFWNVVSNYSHKDTISRIQKLQQITTDVGRCRVWIRLALNEAELTSYFIAMERDKRPLNSFYSHHAFLRDRETCDMACKFLEGLIPVQFEFPINSSILNTWTSEPLMLSGIWSPPIKTPLASAVDVAERIEDEDCDTDTCSIRTSSSVTTLSTILALDETQALKMILDAPFRKINKDSGSISPSLSSPQIPTKYEFNSPIKEEEEHIQGKNVNSQEEENVNKNELTESITKGNSLSNTALGWSSACDIRIPATDHIDIEKDPKIEEYSSLLEKVGISSNKKINYEDKLKEMMEKQGSMERESSTLNDDSNSYSSYTSKLYKIVREIGLKAQKYTCSNCQLSIGLTFGEARLCHFTGEYFCTNCHLNETSVIPSRILFNWDHKKYPVCSKAFKYLSDVCNRLLIDIKNVNPKLYSAVKEMKDLRLLRVQLNMLRAYLYTCKESLLIELQKKVTPREYMYEFIDHYSVNDLCQVPGGSLTSELVNIVSFGKCHVVNCWLCSQKGFICEICKNSQVIYPFDVSATYRCSKCCAIYHDTCLTSNKNCPKCIRIKSRSENKSKMPNSSE